MKRGLAFAMVVCAAVGVTVAGDRVGIGVKAGTYGIAIDVTGRINDVLAIRGSYSAFDYSDEVEVEDIEYDGDLALGGAGLMLDVHPFKNGFRLTGGYFSNRNDIELEAVPTEDIEIGDSTYTPGKSERSMAAWSSRTRRHTSESVTAMPRAARGASSWSWMPGC